MDHVLWVCHSYDFTQHHYANRLVAQALKLYASYDFILSNACVKLQNVSSDIVESNSSPRFVELLLQTEVNTSQAISCEYGIDVSRHNFIEYASTISPDTSLAKTIYTADICDLQSYTYRGVPVGLYSFVDLSLCRKANDPARYPAFFRHTLYLCCLYLNKLSQQSIPPTILILENEYSYCKCLEHYAKHEYVSIVNKYHFLSTDQQSITFYQDQFKDIFLRRAMASSPIILNEEAKAYYYVYDYLVKRILRSTSSHSYSPKLQPWRTDSDIQLYLESHHPCIAYFSSSLDEILPNRISLDQSNTIYLEKPSPFTSELQFVKQLALFSASQGYGLIIRLHPRLGNESRSSYESPHLEEWRSLILGISNMCEVFVVWPEDQLNSYQIGLRADVCTYWWSTIGVELALLGCKVMPAIHDRASENIRYTFEGWPSEPVAWFKALMSLLEHDAKSNFGPLFAAKSFYFSMIFGAASIDNWIEADPSFAMCSLKYGSFWATIAKTSNIKPDTCLLAKAKYKYLLLIQQMLHLDFALPSHSYQYLIISGLLSDHGGKLSSSADELLSRIR